MSRGKEYRERRYLLCHSQDCAIILGDSSDFSGLKLDLVEMGIDAIFLQQIGV